MELANTQKLSAIRLRDILNEKCMSAQELANRSGVSKASLSQYLSGKYTPKNTSAKKLADVLKVNPAWLMGLDVTKDIEIDYMASKAIDLVADTYSIEEIEKAINTLNTRELKRLSAYIEYIKAKRQENEE